MRRTRGVVAAFLGAAMSAGCSGAPDPGGADQVKPVSSRSAEPSRQAAPAKPETAAEFLALAKEAMAGEQGWTFAVKGSEELVLQGRKSAATCTATVHRTTGDPWTLHSTGTSRSKGVAKSAEVYFVDGTGYVKAGGAAWKHGPLSAPEFADRAEGPVAALDTFQAYADVVSLAESDGRVELRVRTASAALTAVRDQGVERAGSPWSGSRSRSPSTLRRLDIPGRFARLPVHLPHPVRRAAHPLQPGRDGAERRDVRGHRRPAGRGVVREAL